MKIRRLQLKNNEYSLLFQIALIIFAITVCSYGLNQLGIMDQYRDFANVILIGSISILLFVQFSQFLISTLERGIILAGYIIRILVAWIDIYAADHITVLHSGDDSIAFWNVSLEIKRTGDAFRASAYSMLRRKQISGTVCKYTVLSWGCDNRNCNLQGSTDKKEISGVDSCFY